MITRRGFLVGSAAIVAVMASAGGLDAERVVAAVSPDGRNVIRLWTNPLAYAVSRDGVTVAAKSAIGLRVDGKCLAADAPCRVRTETKAGTVEMPVYKKAKIDLTANETVVDFADWSVRLAARNDGVAYRFETRKPGKIRVDCEKASLAIPQTDERCALNYSDRFGCEETVPVFCRAGEIETGKGPSRKFVYLPFVYVAGGKHVAVTESDVFDYPVWNLERVSGEAGTVAFGSTFAKWPTAEANDSKVDRTKGAKRECHWKVTASADYLVETDGTRTFPWRTFILAEAPTAFCSADIVMALARGRAAHDFSWVKPGKVAWEWWNAWDNKGKAAGCNTATYRRFIDFAAKAGVEYVILDGGWSVKLDIWKVNPNVDVPEIIRYGNEKGVGIILWMAWAQVVGDEARVASHFAKLGAKGFKVDFMDRADAEIFNFLDKFAAACAKEKMLVDYHGVCHPTGLSRTYPNVLNYEGVHGLEQMKFYGGKDMMANDVDTFFLRMTAGPLDYTPGAMINYPVGKYPTGEAAKKANTYQCPGSMGTRCHQMAMMALYEAPLQMLCDSPTNYEKNMESFGFMAKVPVVWAKTVGLGGALSRFVTAARQAKDGAWYAAGLTNNDRRDVELDTAFLGAGQWKAEIFRDAADADVQPTHYVHETKSVKAGEKMLVRMAPGGGFIVKFSK